MADRPEKSVFIVAASEHVQNTLDGIPVPFSMSLTHFSTVTDCREALGVKLCHLLVIDLDGNTVEGLQLLNDSEPAVARISKLALVDHGDIATAVQAIRTGAANCLEKPVENEQLVAEISHLLDQTVPNSPRQAALLTLTETTVLHLILEGKTNHETARALHRSPRTIEVHRKHIMHKLGVSNMVELVKTAASMGLLGAS